MPPPEVWMTRPKPSPKPVIHKAGPAARGVCDKRVDEDPKLKQNCHNCARRWHVECMHRCTKGACGWRFCGECCGNHREKPEYKVNPTGQLEWVPTVEEAQEKILGILSDKEDAKTKKILSKSTTSPEELKILTASRLPETPLSRMVRALAGATLAKAVRSPMVKGSAEASAGEIGEPT